MDHDPIFETVSSDTLSQIAGYLNWNPVVSSSATLLSQLNIQERLRWLDAHRHEVEQHISWVGSPIFSYALGNGKGYRQIVTDLAEQLGVQIPSNSGIAEVELKLIKKLWADAMARVTPDQLRELDTKAQEAAARLGRSARKEITGFAGLAAAQASGFGVYMLGSTLLGAFNSALGLGLGFGAFTGLSSAISVVIGPIGWAALGLFTIRKLGGANYKKLLPVVILVASERAGGPRPAESPPILTIPPTGAVCLTSPTEHRVWPSRPVLSAAVQLAHRWGPAPELGSKPPESGKGQSLGAEGFLQPPVKYPTHWLRDEKKPAKPAHRSFSPTTPHPVAIRSTISNADKRNFCLRERQLCALTEQYVPRGVHFLELASDDQQTLREMLNLQVESEMQASRAAKEPKEVLRGGAPEQLSRGKAAERTAAKQLQNAQATARRLYTNLLPNLVFDDAALKQLELLVSTGNCSQVEKKLALINGGQAKPEDIINGTEPKVLNYHAGYDYRIYASRQGGQTYIRHIGDKGTQLADIERLRRKTNGRKAV